MSDEQIAPTDPERAEWLEWRRKGIGASDVAGIVGVSPWASPFSVWADKAGLTSDSEPTDAMRLGTLVEPLLADLFTERTGHRVGAIQQRCVHPVRKWMRCTLDGMRFDGAEPLGPVEMKWSKDSAKQWADEIPTHYRIQAAWQCAITGHKSMWFAVIHVDFGRPQFEIYPYTPDPGDIAWLIEKAEAFWTDHVLTGVPPEGDATTATEDAIRDVWGWVSDPNGEIEADDDIGLLACMASLKSAKTARKNAEAVERDAKNKLRIRLGDREVITVGGKPAVSWRAQSQSKLDTERLKNEQPDIYEEFTNRTTVRVMREHKNQGVRHG